MRFLRRCTSQRIVSENPLLSSTYNDPDIQIDAHHNDTAGPEASSEPRVYQRRAHSDEEKAPFHQRLCQGRRRSTRCTRPPQAPHNVRASVPHSLARHGVRRRWCRRGALRSQLSSVSTDKSIWRPFGYHREPFGTCDSIPLAWYLTNALPQLQDSRVRGIPQDVRVQEAARGFDHLPESKTSYEQIAWIQRDHKASP